MLNNYPSISNLLYVSTILEKIVLKQLLQHLHENNLFEPLQSACRKGHNTETALTKITFDLLFSFSFSLIGAAIYLSVSFRVTLVTLRSFSTDQMVLLKTYTFLYQCHGVTSQSHTHSSFPTNWINDVSVSTIICTSDAWSPFDSGLRAFWFMKAKVIIFNNRYRYRY